ncbi:MAG: phenylalanine--tRNA ligase subunit alpha [Candidatus Moranbacteria bacterium]|nr:phenylalanine--tRNA ligase subunit alpha [Candidatus Moranbacteria bacterium]
MEKDLINKLKEKLKKTNSLEDYRVVFKQYLGSKGIIKGLLKSIGNLEPSKRKQAAIQAQKIQAKALELLKTKEKTLKKQFKQKALKQQAEKLSFKKPDIGHFHPISQTVADLNEFFIKMGYSVMDGPEIEEDKYCFQRLNVPLNHPARDMQDTLYVEEPDFLLRTQTSSIEARALEQFNPPFKFVSPGRAYRNEKVNKSNHFVLHQYQGVVVQKKVSLKDLFGTFTALFKKMYGKDVVVRYRNKYYPEVEPGVGPDMQCFNCKGKGCALCKGVGWIEMGGAGIIHPKVMKMSGIDAKKWMGFAFGLGLDRWVMAKYNIKDIRTLLGGYLAYQPKIGEVSIR